MFVNEKVSAAPQVVSAPKGCQGGRANFEIAPGGSLKGPTPAPPALPPRDSWGTGSLNMASRGSLSTTSHMASRSSLSTTCKMVARGSLSTKSNTVVEVVHTVLCPKFPCVVYGVCHCGVGKAEPSRDACDSEANFNQFPFGKILVSPWGAESQVTPSTQGQECSSSKPQRTQGLGREPGPQQDLGREPGL